MSPAAYDVVVVGGGPAGTATALALLDRDPELSIALVEASTYSEPRIGETLPPQARRLLEQLGVWEAFRADGHTRAYGTTAVWGDDKPHANDFIFRPYGEGWHLDRARFDELLANRAQARGCTLSRGCTLVGCESAPADPDGSLWHLEVRRGKLRTTLTTRFVVDASGRRAAFARRQGAQKILFDQLVGVYAFLKLRDGEDYPTTHAVVEAWKEGWWYSARLPDDRLVVACMTDADRVSPLGLRRREPWLAALERSGQTRGVLAVAEPEAAPRCYPAQSQFLEPCWGDGWLAVGDAASTFDPLSSLGIFKALRLGIHASYAIADSLEGDERALEKYGRLVGAEFESYLDTRAEYYRQEGRWPESSFWYRRFGHLTLDPEWELAAAARTSRGPAMHLTAAQLDELRTLCRTPRKAKQLVAEFQRQTSNSLSDRRVILALQHLLTTGQLIRSPGSAVRA